MWTLINLRNDQILGFKLKRAENFLSRTIGLLGAPHLLEGSGLILERCNQIHMFGMRFPLDLVFLSEGNVVLDLVVEIQPWKISQRVHGALRVVELPIGVIERTQSKVGDQMQFERSSDNLR